MSHHHVHAPLDPAPPDAGDSADRVRHILLAVVVPLVALTVAGLAVLWPRGPVPEVSAVRDAYQGVTFAQVTVRSVSQAPCAGTAADRQADGSIPQTTVCTTVAATLDDGADAGTVVRFGIPPHVVRSGVTEGDHLRVARYPEQDGVPAVYAFLDFAREVPLSALTVVFVVLVVLVAGRRGLLSLFGLGVALATTGFFVVPALRRGESPALVGGVAATAMMIVVLYLAHGVSRKTTTALLGTVAGIWVSTGLAVWVTRAARLTGLTGEENIQLSRFSVYDDLSALVLCGIVLAGLGVLNDVTITQASSVWELHASAPSLSAARLFASGMQIGRDHLASTVYTLAFAYVGTALPSLLLSAVYGEPLRQLLSQGEIAEEIARTLVASLGLLLAIPLTTAIAVIVVRGTSRRAPAERTTRRTTHRR